MLRRLRYWIESAKRSEALREEMELHLAEKAAELQADGMTAERARAEARRRFGNVGLKHEESRHPVLVVGRPVAVTIPLSLTFASLLDAHAWLLRNPLEVTVDGVPAAAGAQVASKALIEVHCEVAPGAHDLVVSARQRGLGGLGPRRIVYLARRCRIAEGGPRGHTVLDR